MKESRREANHLFPTRAQSGLCGTLPSLPTNALTAMYFFSYLPLKKGRIDKSRLSFPMTVEKEFYTYPQARTYALTQRNSFCLGQTAFYFAILHKKSYWSILATPAQ